MKPRTSMAVEELRKFVRGISCEKCSRTCWDGDEMYWYADLGGWTRVFCDEHVPRFDGKLGYGAKPLSLRTHP